MEFPGDSWVGKLLYIPGVRPFCRRCSLVTIPKWVVFLKNKLWCMATCEIRFWKQNWRAQVFGLSLLDGPPEQQFIQNVNSLFFTTSPCKCFCYAPGTLCFGCLVNFHHLNLLLTWHAELDRCHFLVPPGNEWHSHWILLTFVFFIHEPCYSARVVDWESSLSPIWSTASYLLHGMGR